MDFSFLSEYKLSEELIATVGIKTVINFRHYFYVSDKIDLLMVQERLKPFPIELKAFYEEIGFGFMHRKSGIKRIFDPISLVTINLLESEFRYDKRMCEIVKQNDLDKQLLFFEEKSGKFLSIKRKDSEGKNAIYYREYKLTNSLHEFITQYHNDKYWLEYALDK